MLLGRLPLLCEDGETTVVRMKIIVFGYIAPRKFKNGPEILLIRTRGLVVMTVALHAIGREFEPHRVLFLSAELPLST